MAKQTIATQCGHWCHENVLEAYGGAGQPNLQRQGSFVGETVPQLSWRDD